MIASSHDKCYLDNLTDPIPDKVDATSRLTSGIVAVATTDTLHTDPPLDVCFDCLNRDEGHSSTRKAN